MVSFAAFAPSLRTPRFKVLLVRQILKRKVRKELPQRAPRKSYRDAAGASDMRGGTVALFFCLRSAAFRATKYKLTKVSIGSATASHPVSTGFSRIINNPRKQNATCVQNTGREACPMITSGPNASFFSDSWKRISRAATQINSIGRTIPKCHLSKAGSNRPRSTP